MSAGQLRERVTFKRLGAGGGDGAGNAGTAFANIANAVGVPADLSPIKSAEVVIGQGIEGRRIYEVTVRYSTALMGVDVQDRMIDARDATRVFNVIAPPLNKDKRRKYLTLMVEQGGASG